MSRTHTEPPGTPASAVETELEREVRQLRERLAYYEGFDALIAENVRQSGELMRQALSSREQASVVSAIDRAELIERFRELTGDLADVQTRLGAIVDAFARLEATIAGPTVATSSPVASKAAGGARKSPNASVPNQPSTIDVVVHGLTRATPALALQRHLAALDGVVGVETREFAEGILRLRVTANRALADADLAGWEAGNIDTATFDAGLVSVILKPA